MVRHATPLVVAPMLPAIYRIEMLIATARLLLQPTGVEEAEGQLLTVLVSFDPTDAERRATRVLAASFIAAAYSFEQVPAAADVGTWLAEMLHGLPASSACIVIALPEHEAAVERQLQMFVTAARTAGRHEVALVVGVATTPADWVGCELDGFVIVERGQRVSGALQVFATLAAVMAPGLMCPLDADDFRCALGTAANPSQIAQATYFPESLSFVPASRVDRQMLGNARGVAVMPSRSLRVAEHSRLVAAVRASAQPESTLTIVLPWGLFAESLGAGRSVEVLLLCREAHPGAGAS